MSWFVVCAPAEDCKNHFYVHGWIHTKGSPIPPRSTRRTFEPLALHTRPSTRITAPTSAIGGGSGPGSASFVEVALLPFRAFLGDGGGFSFFCRQSMIPLPSSTSKKYIRVVRTCKAGLTHCCTVCYHRVERLRRLSQQSEPSCMVLSQSNRSHLSDPPASQIHPSRSMRQLLLAERSIFRFRTPTTTIFRNCNSSSPASVF